MAVKSRRMNHWRRWLAGGACLACLLGSPAGGEPSSDAFDLSIKHISKLWYAQDHEGARKGMRALEAGPRPSDARKLLPFYRLRAELAEDPKLAERDFLEAVEIAPTPEDKGYVYQDLFNLSLKDGDTQKARKWLASAFQMTRFSPNKTLRQGLLGCQHKLLVKEERYEDAEACLQGLLLAAQQQQDAREEGRIWLELSRDFAQQGKSDEADRCAHNALTLAEKSGDRSAQYWIAVGVAPNSVSAEARSWRAEVLKKLLASETSGEQKTRMQMRLADFQAEDGDLAGAEAGYRRALDFAGAGPEVNEARNSLAMNLDRLGKYEEALALNRQALEATPPGQRRRSLQLGIKLELYELGRYPESVELSHKWLEKTTSWVERAEILDSLVYWAQSERDLAEYLRDLKELLAILPQLPEKEQMDFGERLPTRLALLQGPSSAEAVPALSKYEQSIREQIQRENRPRTAARLRSGLASFLQSAGHRVEAVELLRQNLEVARQGDDKEALLAAITRLLVSLDAKKDYREIEALSDEALASKTNRTWPLYLLWERALLYKKNGEWEKARIWLLKWIEDSRRLSPRDVPRGQNSLAEVEAHLGHPKIALALYQEISGRPGATPDEVVESRLHAGKLRHVLGDVAGEREEYALAYRACLGRLDPYRLAEIAIAYQGCLERANQDTLPLLQEAGARLGELLQEVPARLRASHLRITTFYALWAEKLTQAHRTEDALAVLSQGRSAEVLRQWKALNVTSRDPQVRGLLGKLEKLSESMQAGGTTPASATVRQAFLTTLNELRQKEPLIANQVTLRATQLKSLQARLTADQRLVQYYSSAHTLYVFIIGPQQLELRSVAVDSARLGALVRRLRELVGTPHPDAGELRTANDSLYELLIEPLGDALKARQLLISPSGPLWYLPFSALRDPQGGYLGERCCLSYLATGDLLKLMDGTLSQTSGGPPLVLRPPVGAGLPATQGEVAELRRLYPATREAHTRQELLSQASDLSILHIASHAKALPKSPNDSYVLLPDGHFSLAEIYGLTLAHGSLVVLSTCDGGLGEDDPGPEPASLATAFSTAGAGSVVSSLWEVDDQATALIFKEFYSQLRQGCSRSLALQRAQAACKAKYPEPYYWAAFTLLGSPQ